MHSFTYFTNIWWIPVICPYSVLLFKLIIIWITETAWRTNASKNLKLWLKYKLYILNFYYLFYKHRISIICNLLFYHALSCFLCGEDLKVNYRNHSLSTGINFFILWLHNNLLYKLITISPSDLYRKVFLFNPPFLIRMFL